MAVTHYDIDDQWNKGNIAAAQKARAEDEAWHKKFDKEFVGYKYIGCLPEEDDAAEEI